MASEAIITEELICKAAEQLAAEGMRPTNETVRELLAKWTSTKGGSYATIGPVLRAWKARRKAADQGQCGEPRGQSQQDQQWEKVLGEGGQVRGHFRRQQWHLVFAAKQRQCRSRQFRCA